jgi:hypothetical protein
MLWQGGSPYHITYDSVVGVVAKSGSSTVDRGSWRAPSDLIDGKENDDQLRILS